MGRQRVSEGVKAEGLGHPPVEAQLHGEEEGGRGAEELFKTPYLCEGHLSLRPVTMATGPAQCRGEGAV